MQQSRVIAFLVFAALIVSACAAPTTGAVRSSTPGTASVAPTQASKAAPPVEKKDLTIGIQLSTITVLPVRLTDSLGYFKDEGLNVKFANLVDGNAGILSLSGGSMEFASTNLASVIQANLQGGRLVTTSLYNVVTGQAVMVGEKYKNAKSITEFASEPIGVNAVGSSADTLLRVLFVQNGLDPATLKVVAVGRGPAAIAALAKGVVNVEVQNDPTKSQLEISGLAKTLYDEGTIAGSRAIYGGVPGGGGLTTTQDFLRANPGTVAAVGRAVARALKWLQTHTPDDIINALPDAQASYFPDGNKALFVTQVDRLKDAFSGDGTVQPDMPELTLRALKIGNPQIDYSKLDLSKTYDSSWAGK